MPIYADESNSMVMQNVLCVCADASAKLSHVCIICNMLFALIPHSSSTQTYTKSKYIRLKCKPQRYCYHHLNH